MNLMRAKTTSSLKIGIKMITIKVKVKGKEKPEQRRGIASKRDKR
jgi:hypothetical protein